jgi:SAM-dependent methyltransferase
MTGKLHCPLCATGKNTPFFSDKRRDYLRCDNCALVFVPPVYFLTREAERAEYDLHQNEVDNPGYRQFLSRLARPLLERLPSGASGLDFGCGPGPALAQILRDGGCQVVLYDSFYHPDRSVLGQHFDFISATEVVEHLHSPGAQLQQLWQQLNAGGWLGVMTKLVRDAQAFASWHYKNDPTHVSFFSEMTWHWWAQRYGASIEILGADVILLQKQG